LRWRAWGERGRKTGQTLRAAKEKGPVAGAFGRFGFAPLTGAANLLLLLSRRFLLGGSFLGCVLH
jgi:hypothetical protein